MNKFKKKELLVPVREPLFIRHAANEKHREITVCILTIALPLATLSGGFINEDVLKAVKKVSTGFPDANLEFNYNPKAPAFVFSVKGKTECRGNDVADQRIGDAVAEAKANAKACTIVNRVATAIAAVMQEKLKRVGDILNFSAMAYQKEVDYIEKEHYMRILNRDSSANIQNS
jgi:hypothetical protein